MTSNYILVGKLTIHELHLDDADEHTVVAALDKRQVSRTVESILVTATAADDVTIRVRNDSGVVFVYASALDVTENNDYHKVNHPRVLKPGERITAEAGTGTLWISVITCDTPIQLMAPSL